MAAVLNRHVHFRYGRDEAGRIGVWDVLHPYYTVPRRDAPDLFAMKATFFTPDYAAFLPRFQADYAWAAACGRRWERSPGGKAPKEPARHGAVVDSYLERQVIRPRVRS